MDIQALRNKEEQVKKLLKAQFETEIRSDIGVSSYIIFRDGTLVGAYKHRDMMNFLRSKGVLTDEDVERFDITVFTDAFGCVSCYGFNKEGSSIELPKESLTSDQESTLADWIDADAEKSKQLTINFNEGNATYNYDELFKAKEWPSEYIIQKIKDGYLQDKLMEDIHVSHTGVPSYEAPKRYTHTIVLTPDEFLKIEDYFVNDLSKRPFLTTFQQRVCSSFNDILQYKDKILSGEMVAFIGKMNGVYYLIPSRPNLNTGAVRSLPYTYVWLTNPYVGRLDYSIYEDILKLLNNHKEDVNEDIDIQPYSRENNKHLMSLGVPNTDIDCYLLSSDCVREIFSQLDNIEFTSEWEKRQVENIPLEALVVSTWMYFGDRCTHPTYESTMKGTLDTSGIHLKVNDEINEWIKDLIVNFPCEEIYVKQAEPEPETAVDAHEREYDRVYRGNMHEELRKDNLQELITHLQAKKVDIKSFWNICDASQHLEGLTDEELEDYNKAREELHNIQSKVSVTGFYKGEPDPGSYLVWDIPAEKAIELGLRLRQEDIIHTQISEKYNTILSVRYKNAQNHDFKKFDEDHETSSLVLVDKKPDNLFKDRGCTGWSGDGFFYSFDLYREYSSAQDKEKFHKLELDEDIKLSTVKIPKVKVNPKYIYADPEYGYKQDYVLSFVTDHRNEPHWAVRVFNNTPRNYDEVYIIKDVTFNEAYAVFESTEPESCIPSAQTIVVCIDYLGTDDRCGLFSRDIKRETVHEDITVSEPGDSGFIPDEYKEEVLNYLSEFMRKDDVNDIRYAYGKKDWTVAMDTEDYNSSYPYGLYAGDTCLCALTTSEAFYIINIVKKYTHKTNEDLNIDTLDVPFDDKYYYDYSDYNLEEVIDLINTRGDEEVWTVCAYLVDDHNRIDRTVLITPLTTFEKAYESFCSYKMKNREIAISLDYNGVWKDTILWRDTLTESHAAQLETFDVVEDVKPVALPVPKYDYEYAADTGDRRIYVYNTGENDGDLYFGGYQGNEPRVNTIQYFYDKPVWFLCILDKWNEVIANGANQRGDFNKKLPDEYDGVRDFASTYALFEKYPLEPGESITLCIAEDFKDVTEGGWFILKRKSTEMPVEEDINVSTVDVPEYDEKYAYGLGDRPMTVCNTGMDDVLSKDNDGLIRFGGEVVNGREPRTATIKYFYDEPVWFICISGGHNERFNGLCGDPGALHLPNKYKGAHTFVETYDLFMKHHLNEGEAIYVTISSDFDNLDGSGWFILERKTNDTPESNSIEEDIRPVAPDNSWTISVEQHDKCQDIHKFIAKHFGEHLADEYMDFSAPWTVVKNGEDDYTLYAGGSDMETHSQNIGFSITKVDWSDDRLLSEFKDALRNTIGDSFHEDINVSNPIEYLSRFTEPATTADLEKVMSEHEPAAFIIGPEGNLERIKDEYVRKFVDVDGNYSNDASFDYANNDLRQTYVTIVNFVRGNIGARDIYLPDWGHNLTAAQYKTLKELSTISKASTIAIHSVGRTMSLPEYIEMKDDINANVRPGRIILQSRTERIIESREEYFKNSMVRNSDGTLKPVYHCSFNDFDTFIIGNEDGTLDFDDWKGESGFAWFSESEWYAQQYGDADFEYECYLNITNPLDLGDINQNIFDENGTEVKIKQRPKGRRYRFTDWWESSDSVKVSDAFINLCKLVDIAPEDMLVYAIKWGETEMIFDLTRRAFFKNLVVKKGYDGVTAIESGYRTWGCVRPNQIKLINNDNPTDSDSMKEDITPSTVEKFEYDVPLNKLEEIAEYIDSQDDGVILSAKDLILSDLHHKVTLSFNAGDENVDCALLIYYSEYKSPTRLALTWYLPEYEANYILKNILKEPVREDITPVTLDNVNILAKGDPNGDPSTRVTIDVSTDDEVKQFVIASFHETNVVNKLYQMAENPEYIWEYHTIIAQINNNYGYITIRHGNNYILGRYDFGFRVYDKEIRDHIIRSVPELSHYLKEDVNVQTTRSTFEIPEEHKQFVKECISELPFIAMNIDDIMEKNINNKWEIITCNNDVNGDPDSYPHRVVFGPGEDDCLDISEYELGKILHAAKHGNLNTFREDINVTHVEPFKATLKADDITLTADQYEFIKQYYEKRHRGVSEDWRIWYVNFIKPHEKQIETGDSFVVLNTTDGRVEVCSTSNNRRYPGAFSFIPKKMVKQVLKIKSEPVEEDVQPSAAASFVAKEDEDEDGVANYQATYVLSTDMLYVLRNLVDEVYEDNAFNKRIVSHNLDKAIKEFESGDDFHGPYSDGNFRLHIAIYLTDIDYRLWFAHCIEHLVSVTREELCSDTPAEDYEFAKAIEQVCNIEPSIIDRYKDSLLNNTPLHITEDITITNTDFDYDPKYLNLEPGHDRREDSIQFINDHWNEKIWYLVGHYYKFDDRGRHSFGVEVSGNEQPPNNFTNNKYNGYMTFPEAYNKFMTFDAAEEASNYDVDSGWWITMCAKGFNHLNGNHLNGDGDSTGEPLDILFRDELDSDNLEEDIQPSKIPPAVYDKKYLMTGQYCGQSMAELIDKYQFEESWYLDELNYDVESLHSGKYDEFVDNRFNGLKTFEDAYKAFLEYKFPTEQEDKNYRDYADIRIVYCDMEDENDVHDIDTLIKTRYQETREDLQLKPVPDKAVKDDLFNCYNVISKDGKDYIIGLFNKYQDIPAYKHIVNRLTQCKDSDEYEWILDHDRFNGWILSVYHILNPQTDAGHFVLEDENIPVEENEFEKYMSIHEDLTLRPTEQRAFYDDKYLVASDFEDKAAAIEFIEENCEEPHWTVRTISMDGDTVDYVDTDLTFSEAYKLFLEIEPDIEEGEDKAVLGYDDYDWDGDNGNASDCTCVDVFEKGEESIGEDLSVQPIDNKIKLLYTYSYHDIKNTDDYRDYVEYYYEISPSAAEDLLTLTDSEWHGELQEVSVIPNLPEGTHVLHIEHATEVNNTHAVWYNLLTKLDTPFTYQCNGLVYVDDYMFNSSKYQLMKDINSMLGIELSDELTINEDISYAPSYTAGNSSSINFNKKYLAHSNLPNFELAAKTLIQYFGGNPWFKVELSSHHFTRNGQTRWKTRRLAEGATFKDAYDAFTGWEFRDCDEDLTLSLDWSRISDNDRTELKSIGEEVIPLDKREWWPICGNILERRNNPISIRAISQPITEDLNVTAAEPVVKYDTRYVANDEAYALIDAHHDEAVWNVFVWHYEPSDEKSVVLDSLWLGATFEDAYDTFKDGVDVDNYSWVNTDEVYLTLEYENVDTEDESIVLQRKITDLCEDIRPQPVDILGMIAPYFIEGPTWKDYTLHNYPREVDGVTYTNEELIGTFMGEPYWQIGTHSSTNLGTGGVEGDELTFEQAMERFLSYWTNNEHIKYVCIDFCKGNLITPVCVREIKHDNPPVNEDIIPTEVKSTLPDKAMNYLLIGEGELSGFSSFDEAIEYINELADEPVWSVPVYDQFGEEEDHLGYDLTFKEAYDKFINYQLEPAEGDGFEHGKCNIVLECCPRRTHPNYTFKQAMDRWYNDEILDDDCKAQHPLAEDLQLTKVEPKYHIEFKEDKDLFESSIKIVMDNPEASELVKQTYIAGRGIKRNDFAYDVTDISIEYDLMSEFTVNLQYNHGDDENPDLVYLEKASWGINTLGKFQALDAALKALLSDKDYKKVTESNTFKWAYEDVFEGGNDLDIDEDIQPITLDVPKYERKYISNWSFNNADDCEAFVAAHWQDNGWSLKVYDHNGAEMYNPISDRPSSFKETYDEFCNYGFDYDEDDDCIVMSYYDEDEDDYIEVFMRYKDEDIDEDITPVAMDISEFSIENVHSMGALFVKEHVAHAHTDGDVVRFIEEHADEPIWNLSRWVGDNLSYDGYLCDEVSFQEAWDELVSQAQKQDQQDYFELRFRKQPWDTRDAVIILNCTNRNMLDEDIKPVTINVNPDEANKELMSKFLSEMCFAGNEDNLYEMDDYLFEEFQNDIECGWHFHDGLVDKVYIPWMGDAEYDDTMSDDMANAIYEGNTEFFRAHEGYIKPYGGNASNMEVEEAIAQEAELWGLSQEEIDEFIQNNKK